MKPSPYEGFDPLSEADHWEDRDRRLVLSRLHDIPQRRFFSEDETRVLEAVVDRIVPQPDRRAGAKVPVTPFVDQALAEDETDGFRKEGMPWDQEVWRMGVAGIEQTSHARHARSFTELDEGAQDDVLRAVQAGNPEGEVWRELPAAAVFHKLTQEIVSVYYAHPSAWAEIGWPGPASRRGYMRTGYGQFDPWQPRPATGSSSVHLLSAPEGGTPSGAGGGTP